MFERPKCPRTWPWPRLAGERAPVACAHCAEVSHQVVSFAAIVLAPTETPRGPRSIPNMKYIAIMNYDFMRTRKKDDKERWQKENNAYEELKAALAHLGWEWTETSAFLITTKDAARICEGASLVARQAPKPGDLSAFNLCIQTASPRDTTKVKKQFPNALKKVRARKLPF